MIYFEDLKINEFLSIFEGQKSAFEKLDGSQLWVGVDDTGLFVSREGKRNLSRRKYSSEDWVTIQVNDQFRAAHKAIEAKKDVFLSLLPSGSVIELEVLYGTQPNTVIYDKPAIAFLRPVEETSTEIYDKLVAGLLNQTVQIDTFDMLSSDGFTVEKVSKQIVFEFVKPKQFTLPIIKKVQELKTFLEQKSEYKDLSNKDLCDLLLTKVPLNERDVAKTARAKIQSTIYTEYKIPIKREILKSLNFSGEGLVVGLGEELVKIVNKSEFMLKNKFNQYHRNRISSQIMSLDANAAIESKGGIVGNLRVKIAYLLGNKELAKSSSAKNVIQNLGSDPTTAFNKFVDNISTGIPDFQQIKMKILAITSRTYKQLKEEVQTFQTTKDTFEISFNNEKYKLSEEVKSKTLTAFAEAQVTLVNLFSKIKNCADMKQMLFLLYGHYFKNMAVQESLMESKRKYKHRSHHPDISLSEFDKRDFYQLFHGYLSTAFLSILFLKNEDAIGTRKVRDKMNCHLKRWTDTMSAFNHWGMVIFKPHNKDISKHISKKTQSEISKMIKPIPPMQYRLFHQQISFAKDIAIDYDNHRALLNRLVLLSKIKSNRLNTLINFIFDYDILSFDEKIKGHNILFLFCQQFIPRSTLFARYKNFMNEFVLNGGNMKFNRLKKLAEDDGGETSTSNTNLSASTASSDIAPVLNGVGGTKRIIIKRARNPEVQKLKMKFRREK